jgi:hypothetical protein
MQQEMQNWEKVLSTYNEESAALNKKLSKREIDIKNRIDSRQLSDKDKLIMAMALLVPAALAGATLGKEGFFGVLGGTAKGAADVLVNKQKEQLYDEEKLDELGLQKLKVAQEGLKHGAELEEKRQKICRKYLIRRLKRFSCAMGKSSAIN